MKECYIKYIITMLAGINSEKALRMIYFVTQRALDHEKRPA